MEEKKTRKEERTKAWTFVTYPESVPENWREVLGGHHVPWVESPLHDADSNADETQKKPHWHVMMLFAGMKSYEQVSEITKSINATIPQKVSSVRGMVRYFAHMDNPEKRQYSITDIIAHGGAEIKQHLVDPKEHRHAMISEMMDWVSEMECVEFFDLMNYAKAAKTDWFEMLCDNSANIMEKYVRSLRYKNEKIERRTEAGRPIGSL